MYLPPLLFRKFSGHKIHVSDVSIRDGSGGFVPVEDKIRWVNELSRAGLKKIEVASFASQDAIHALRDAEKIMARIERVAGVVYAALVTDIAGAERAMKCGADEIRLMISASETHNLVNTRATIGQSALALKEIARMAQGKTAVNVSIATAFGCPLEGPVAEEEVIDIGDWFAHDGVNGITLCDTTGVANPMQVEQLCDGLPERWKGIELTLHFHNARGMGMANVLASMAAGIDRYEASLGGIGGTRDGQGVAGDLCTEDLAHMLEAMGCVTGVDLDALLACSARLPELIGRDVPGLVRKAGKSYKTCPLSKGPAEIRAEAQPSIS